MDSGVFTFKEDSCIFKEDLRIAKALLNRDAKTTVDFMFNKCYPMFKAMFDNYYTDCQNCEEFITTIYTIVLTPGVRTGYPPLQNYRGESSLKTWLTMVAKTYCYDKHKKKIFIVDLQQNKDKCGENTMNLVDVAGYEMMDMSEIIRQDEETIQKLVLNNMPNKRYSEMLWLYLIDKKSHKEIAQIMGFKNMANYYNKRKEANKQYIKVRKEMKL